MFNKIVAMATVAAFGLATPALADDDDMEFGGGDYEAFSENYDRSGRFERMDSDEDGMISRDEQMEAEFRRFDRDRDGMLDEEESESLNVEYEEEREEEDT